MFSLIVPAHNTELYLRECLDSILVQSCKNWECICVDDGSTDSSGEILDEYATKDSRFRVVHQANSGVSAARNVALDYASGDWIWFIDSDDAIHPEAVRHVARIVSGNSGLDVYAFKDYVRGVSCPENWSPLSNDSIRETTCHRVDELLFFHIGACNVVFRRSKFGKLRMKPYSVGEDILFFNDIFWNSDRVVLDDNLLYFYRKNELGVSLGNHSALTVRDNLTIERLVLEDIRSRLPDHPEFDISRYLTHFQSYLMTMNEQKFLKLSDSGRRSVLLEWLHLQTLVLQLNGGKRYLRSAVALLRLFRSGWLAKRLIQFVLRADDRSPEILLRIFANKIKANRVWWLSLCGFVEFNQCHLQTFRQ